MGENGLSVKIERVTSVNDALVSQLNPLLDEGAEWDAEQGAKFLDNPDNALFLAFVDRTAAGFLTAYRLQRLDKQRAEVLLYEIGVQEEFQRQGIGTRLVEAVKEWAGEAGAGEVWVLTYASNAAAMALYKSTGGEEEPPGTRMFTYNLG